MEETQKENPLKNLDFYDFLGIPKTSNSKEIQKAYYKLALKLHPDKITDLSKKEESKEEFQILNKIYTILSNEKKRKLYDDGKYFEYEEVFEYSDISPDDFSMSFNIPIHSKLFEIFASARTEDEENEITTALKYAEKLNKQSVWDKKIFKDELKRAKNERISILEFERKSIEEIPNYIGKLDFLTMLILNNNKISKISPSIEKLNLLKILDLQVNEIITLPSEIGNLSSLSILILNHNKLETLPETIGNLKKLSILKCFANRLNFIPSQIENCLELKELDLELNFLKDIPWSLFERKKKHKFKLIVDKFVRRNFSLKGKEGKKGDSVKKKMKMEK